MFIFWLLIVLEVLSLPETSTSDFHLYIPTGVFRKGFRHLSDQLTLVKFAVYIGDEILPMLDRDYFISHYKDPRIPINQPISWNVNRVLLPLLIVFVPFEDLHLTPPRATSAERGLAWISFA